MAIRRPRRGKVLSANPGRLSVWSRRASVARRGYLSGLIFLSAFLTGACLYIDSETPDYRQNAAITDNCEQVEREPTGDLAEDIVGGWHQSSGGGAHPLGNSLGSGRRVYLFRDDGAGHLWWAIKTESSNDGGNQPFRWTVEDGNLIVNDLPPAVVEVVSAGALLRTLDDPDATSDVVVWSRCDPDVIEDA